MRCNSCAASRHSHISPHRLSHACKPQQVGLQLAHLPATPAFFGQGPARTAARTAGQQARTAGSKDHFVAVHSLPAGHQGLEAGSWPLVTPLLILLKLALRMMEMEWNDGMMACRRTQAHMCILPFCRLTNKDNSTSS